MAIAYSTSGQLGNVVSGSTSGSINIDVGSATDRMLWVGIVADVDGTDRFTSITYNGTSLTKLVGRRMSTSAQYITLWYLLNPTSGSNTLSVTMSGSGYAYGCFDVFSGCPAASTTVGTNTASAAVTSGTLSLSLTTQGDNAWLVSTVRSVDTGDHAAGTGTTERNQFGASIGDSNGAKSPTGTYSMDWASIPSSYKMDGVMGHFYVSTASTTFIPRIAFII